MVIQQWRYNFCRTDAAAAASGNAGDLAYIFGGSATFKSGGGNDAFQLGAGDTTIKNTTAAEAITFHTGNFTLQIMADLKIVTNAGAITVQNIYGTTGGSTNDVTTQCRKFNNKYRNC